MFIMVLSIFPPIALKSELFVLLWIKHWTLSVHYVIVERMGQADEV